MIQERQKGVALSLQIHLHSSCQWMHAYKMQNNTSTIGLKPNRWQLFLSSVYHSRLPNQNLAMMLNVSCSCSRKRLWNTSLLNMCWTMHLPIELLHTSCIMMMYNKKAVQHKLNPGQSWIVFFFKSVWLSNSLQLIENILSRLPLPWRWHSNPQYKEHNGTHPNEGVLCVADGGEGGEVKDEGELGLFQG